MHYLGIDFGLSRIGVAYSEGSLASPIATYTAKTERQRIALLKDLLTEFDPTVVIIGQTAGTLTPDLERFATLVKRSFAGEVIFVEESLSTVEAHQQLLAGNKSKKNRKRQLDAVAATVILQSYLDENVH